MELSIIASSALVAAIVSAALSAATQRWLLSRKAQVDYESNAKRRLYEAIGPLRLQLLLACRDVVNRVSGHYRFIGGAQLSWKMGADGYYVRSFVYRILRPLAICQLIERQLGTADFAVDKTALALLRFHDAASEVLSGERILLGHPSADWARQTDHLFSDNRRAAAASLIVLEAGQPGRVMEYPEFIASLERGASSPATSDLLAIFGRCKTSLVENPILWLRLVALGRTCNALVESQGRVLGFRHRHYDAAAMLAGVSDDRIGRRQTTEYVAAIEGVVAQGL